MKKVQWGLVFDCFIIMVTRFVFWNSSFIFYRAFFQIRSPQRSRLGRSVDMFPVDFYDVLGPCKYNIEWVSPLIRNGLQEAKIFDLCCLLLLAPKQIPLKPNSNFVLRIRIRRSLIIFPTGFSHLSVHDDTTIKKRHLLDQFVATSVVSLLGWCRVPRLIAHEQITKT